jgi:glutaconyl-CoA decarboxylase
MTRKYRVKVAGETYEVEVEELGCAPRATAVASAAPAAPVAAAPAARLRPAAGQGTVLSPLPGKVLAVLAQAGQKVKRGDLLLVIEAMKMENEIFAGEAGLVHKVHVAAGQNVETGDLLAELAPGD